jgi:serine/threonine protein kinase/Tfp pilus assembly protein PilF
MQALSSLHPSDQVLRDFGNGALDVATADAISAHLDVCRDCLRRVAGISSDGFLDAFRRAHFLETQCQGMTDPDGKGERVASGPDLLRTEPAVATLGDSLLPDLAHRPDYEIRRELGRGGMGVVYLVHNKLMGRDEVFKVMGPQIIERPGVMDRFLREIRSVAQLRHPNIVAAHTAFQSREGLVFAMEYVEGLDLARMVKARGPMPLGNACSYIHQAASGLQHAHEKGMVHRDIKPSNLMLSRDRDRALIKILDFGLAKASLENQVAGLGVNDGEQARWAGADLTLVGQMLGTPDFIAPEQIDDAQKADIRADIYSLGCTLYYLLSGGPPFHASSLSDLLQAHHSVDAALLNLLRPEIPSELAALVARMMAKHPDDRFQTPDEVARALLRFFRGRARSAASPGFGLSQIEAPGESLATAGATEISISPAPLPNADATTVTADLRGRQEERGESPIDVQEPENIEVTPTDPTAPVRKSPRWFWYRLAAGVVLGTILLAAAATYRSITNKGEPVIDNDDTNINDAQHYELGKRLQDQGKLAEAIAEYREAIRLRPDFAKAHVALGIILGRQDKLHQAIAEYREAIRLKPDYASAHNNLAWGLVLSPRNPPRDYQEGLAHARRAVELESNVFTLNTLALAEYRMGHWNESLAASHQSMAIKNGGTGNGWDWFLVAMVQGRKGDKDEARKWFDRAVDWTRRHDPDDPELLQFWSEAAELLGLASPHAAGAASPGETVPAKAH